ncbi:hypothetical protein NA56DRAFT_696466 [Hyaloscypha hepaticicola]|uniref:Uncharacterized protein n=1 Tax=Hyaloscypha hepaticicola TaxID=2082293 RepID=A0A2J6QQZ2_9HELO|nr:hypothetical protein NA56DRAFT_696466 [Hyaloscypha hepaticicola]
MDSFSVAAGVDGLLTSILHGSKRMSHFIDGLRGSPKDIETFLRHKLSRNNALCDWLDTHLENRLNVFEEFKVTLNTHTEVRREGTREIADILEGSITTCIYERAIRIKNKFGKQNEADPVITRDTGCRSFNLASELVRKTRTGVAQMLVFPWLDFLTAQALLVCVTPLLHRRADHQKPHEWKDNEYASATIAIDADRSGDHQRIIALYSKQITIARSTFARRFAEPTEPPDMSIRKLKTLCRAQ